MLLAAHPRATAEAYISCIAACFTTPDGWELQLNAHAWAILKIVQPIRTFAMTIIKIRARAQITLPAKMRKALKVETGDYLQAEVVEGALMLKPIALFDREAARVRVKEAMDTVRYIGPQPEPSDDEVMEEAVQAVKETRKELAREKRARSSR
jgi:bifunctional DNA-binding transcriptional regulator/antitoxin component of YhaV-PrlF toxin-antitoxin module